MGLQVDHADEAEGPRMVNEGPKRRLDRLKRSFPALLKYGSSCKHQAYCVLGFLATPALVFREGSLF